MPQPTNVRESRTKVPKFINMTNGDTPSTEEEHEKPEGAKRTVANKYGAHYFSKGEIQLEPGNVLVYDYTTNTTSKKKVPTARTGDSGVAAGSSSLKIVQWNIERGYKLEGIVAELKTLDADVLLLQEVDLNCERTDYVDVARALCSELNMFGAFAIEFVELDDPCRSMENRIGSGNNNQGRGYHGNATLCKWPLLESEIQCWPHSANLDWKMEGPVLKEPRRGERMVLYTSISSSGGVRQIQEHQPQHTYHCYNLHLEVFAGAKFRARELGDAISHAGQLFQSASKKKSSPPATKVSENESSLSTSSYIICGDLNTMNHGIQRFHPKYCRDKFRFLSLGTTEAEWLAINYLSRTCGGKTSSLLLGGRSLEEALYGAEELTMYEEASGLNFYDPWDLRKDVTMIHKDWNGWVDGKLDWILLSGDIQPEENTMKIGNHDFSMSDHKYLAMTVDVVINSSSSDNNNNNSSTRAKAIGASYQKLEGKIRWECAAFLLVLFVLSRVVSVAYAAWMK